jgi:hypothetical protein
MINRERKNLKVNYIQIDEMVISLLESCYSLNYADISSHFYQLALQTVETLPNIVGPLKPPTGKKITGRNGRTFNITKKVDVPQEVDMSVWCIRGFYPDTGIPFKMTVWQYLGDTFRGNSVNAKITMGTFSDKHKFVPVDVTAIDKYVEEVAEKTILSQPIDNVEKPKRETPWRKKLNYKCMSPKGLPLQKKVKKAK